MRGILGVNARNQKYLHSSRKGKRILDSKLLTKKVLSEAGLPVLETLAVIKTRSELLKFNWEFLPNAFALKPNRGLGGEGIIVVYGKKKNTLEPTWIKSDGSLVSKKELELHIFDILEGNFSLFSLPDVAFFEERAKVSKELKPYSAKGIPDIRIIVFEKVPVMAMLRLPTPESRGRANLHQGAIGVGIDLETGLTTSAFWHQKLIDYYPGTRYLLRGIKIPYFKKILELAVLAQIATGINFLGVDIAIDRDKGPVIFELNARPGLSIQMANLAGLEERLQRVKGLKIKSKEKGVRLAQELFGSSKEDFPPEIISKEKKEMENLSDRKILGPIEEVEIITNNENEQRYKTLAKIDTGAWRSVISFDIAKKLKIEETSNFKIVKSTLGEEIRTIVPLSFILKGERIDTEVSLADRSSMKYEMLIGRRDLKNFIIDPAKKINKE
ncbi:MAG TPA: sugar-transfer associated ATP-grasp domain-containing protein [Candidatus Pacearchaeota archaeon]|nr:sugar-transfer associated ATP-grasp domain-containing protein [Candidatus Pacearchaeota archaeon]HOK94196.1 sugar-transfer associated ATP-grasp domain-containing protein [Candidatus Pacearchaeota archaeon]HPO75420.1 sugar-transfer associated ATP-grasp domain-containing protein [Candidatus Pacearchaeota archaeon]